MKNAQTPYGRQGLIITTRLRRWGGLGDIGGCGGDVMGLVGICGAGELCGAGVVKKLKRSIIILTNKHTIQL